MSRFGVATPGYQEAPPSPSPSTLTIQRTPTRKKVLRVCVLVLGALAVCAGMVVVGRQTAPGPGGPLARGLVLTRSVAPGQQLSGADLAVVEGRWPDQVASALVPVSDENAVLGRSANLALSRGSLLTTADLAGGLVPPSGYQLIGVALKGSEAPTGALLPQDRVWVVYVPAADQSHTSGPKVVSQAIVWKATASQSGTTDVNLLVPAGDGPELSAAAARDEIALTLVH